MTCGSGSSSESSPSKRLKFEANDNGGDGDDEEPVCCGICYIEGGNSIAGEIDCCNHYFCFVCIMEWAKHESRCPICRQRFSNVRRLAKHGIFSSSRDVKVPIRDQVYHPYGNMATGPVDSYAEVKCSICHRETDENLLLLCDLCDTASHTYCVGLGFTVPEGDWFCPDCALARETNVNEEADQQTGRPADEPNVTIFDIVREPSSQVVRRPSASASQQNPSSSPSVIPLRDRVSRFKGKNPISRVQHVQRNVQALRENWNALRSGSLRFRCNSFQSGGTGRQNEGSSSLSRDISDKSHSMASSSSQQYTVQCCPSGNTMNERGLEDVDKAWKMMGRAMIMERSHQRIRSVSHGVNHPSGNRGARKISSAHCNFQELTNQQLRIVDSACTRMDRPCDFSNVNSNSNICQSSKVGEKKRSRVTCEENMQHPRRRTAHSEGHCEPPLPRKVHTNIQGFAFHEGGGRNVAKEQGQSACFVTSVGSTPSHGKFGSAFSSSRDAGIVHEEKRPAKSFGGGNSIKSEDAKSEIQSLVKLNLKVLTRDKQLGVETFKIIARQATHTILAACRSEQQKSDVCSSSSVCSHGDHALQFQKSSLMQNCCRECFYAFVNNVVNSTMLEKVGCA